MGRLVVFTGAGLSADSGISTFRDSNGLWEKNNIDEVCNYRTWRSNYDLVHRFYNARRKQLGEVKPNAAHYMIARLQQRYPMTSIITQNIDDLLERAGVRDVMHVHGFLREMRCEACGHVWDIGYREWTQDDACPRERGGSVCGCRRAVKPNVVFFNEAAPLYHAMYDTLLGLRRGDVLLVIGTSGQVIDIGAIASETEATTILSNLETAQAPWTPYSPIIQDEQFDFVLHGRAAERADDIERKVVELLG